MAEIDRFTPVFGVFGPNSMANLQRLGLERFNCTFAVLFLDLQFNLVIGVVHGAHCCCLCPIVH